jgi:hypothetical protein
MGLDCKGVSGDLPQGDRGDGAARVRWSILEQESGDDGDEQR